MIRILEIGRELAATTALAPLLHRIVAAAVDLTDSEIAAVLLPDEQDAATLRFRVATRFADDLGNIPVPVNASIAGAAFLSGEPVVVHDVRTDPRYFAQVTQHIDYPAESLLAVPLMFQGRCIGVLEAENKIENSFDEADVEILTALAAQAAVAIENARLVETLQATREGLERRVAARTADLLALNDQLKEEITDRLRAEAALRESEGRFRAVVEDQTDLICRWRPDGTLIFVNDVYCRFFGRQREELIGQSFAPLAVDEDRAWDRSQVTALNRDWPIATLEHQVRRENGEVRWQRWVNRALFDEAGNLVEFQSVGRDVTDRKMAEEQIRSQRDLLQATIDALNHPFCVINTADYSVEVANAVARRQYEGCEAATCYALHYRRDQPCGNLGYPCPLERVLGSREPVRLEQVTRDADGQIRHLEVYGYPLFDANGQVTRMIEYSMDVTQRKVAERAQREAAAAAEREHLARDLHDSVTQVLFSASLVAEVLPQVWKRDPKEALEGVEELRHLTRGALAETRTLLLELRPAALVESKLDSLLVQLTEAITGRVQIQVTLDAEPVPPLPPDVHLTFYRIAQEALHNVVKHSRASQVTVSLRVTLDSPQPSMHLDEVVELSVRDDGRGFNPDRVRSGQLGLRIMRERADAIGAELGVDSKPGEGTRVTLSWQRSAE